METMLLNRLDAQILLLCNLLTRLSFCNQLEYLYLLWSKGCKIITKRFASKIFAWIFYSDFKGVITNIAFARHDCFQGLDQIVRGTRRVQVACCAGTQDILQAFPIKRV